MKTIILSKTIRLLIPLFLIFSVYILFRGHNHPGGGFIGGLIGSIGFVFHTMVYGASTTRKIFLLIPFYIFIRKPENQSGASTRFSKGVLVYLFKRKERQGIQIGKKKIAIDPIYLIATGLLIAGTSGMLAVLNNLPYMTAYWASFELPIVGKPGTPILFDSGVYLLVIGIIIKITFTMSEE